MFAAQVILLLMGGYLLLGLLFGVPFVLWGVQRVDAAASGTSAAFRLLILPGCVAWWPLLLARWMRSSPPGGHHP